MTSVWLLNSCHYNHVKWLTGILAAATFLFISTIIINYYYYYYYDYDYYYY